MLAGDAGRDFVVHCRTRCSSGAAFWVLAIMSVWLWWAQQFQGTIVGGVGFAGVIATLIANAQLARRERDSTARHERQTLRIALIEELKVLRLMYVGNAKACIDNSITAQLIDVPIFGMTDIYDASVARIGTLSDEEVAKVLHAYLLHRQTRHKITTLLGRLTPTGTSVQVPAANAPILCTLWESVIPIIDAAIDVLGAKT
jgi:hypothetical protein